MQFFQYCSLSGSLRNLVALQCAFLTHAVSVASCKRSFLKLIKKCVSSTMDQATLQKMKIEKINLFWKKCASLSLEDWKFNGSRVKTWIFILPKTWFPIVLEWRLTFSNFSKIETEVIILYTYSEVKRNWVFFVFKD